MCMLFHRLSLSTGNNQVVSPSSWRLIVRAWHAFTFVPVVRSSTGHTREATSDRRLYSNSNKRTTCIHFRLSGHHVQMQWRRSVIAKSSATNFEFSSRLLQFYLQTPTSEKRLALLSVGWAKGLPPRLLPIDLFLTIFPPVRPAMLLRQRLSPLIATI